jgi:1-deoxy-D-xylulose-5-phosphate reductoisomerase
MRVPIAYALHHPNRIDLPVARLDLIAAGSLTFEPVDLEAFPCLRLAREAALAGGTAPCILNAANEIAVHAFLSGRIAFTRIAEVIEATLESLDSRPLSEFEILFAADRTARETARGFLA